MASPKNTNKTKIKDIPFTGKLNTYLDPLLLRENFQSLKNMRYTEISLKGISGMTKINTTALSSYPYIRNCFQYIKSDTNEEHVLVRAFNSAETTSVILDNTTSVPNQGNFNSSVLFTDSSGASTGYFSNAPDSSIAYCNGVDTCIWKGTEARVGSFLNYDTSGNTFDFTEVISNNLDDIENTALLNGVATTGLDSNTMLLLHLENNVVDSSLTTPHAITNYGATYSSAIKKFGTYSAFFTGGAFLSIPDNADFDFSSGVFTIDTWIYISDASTDSYIYRQYTSASNYIEFMVNTYRIISLTLANSSSLMISSSTALDINTWYHVAVVQNNNDLYLFVNGQLKDSTSTALKLANQATDPTIGTSSTGLYVDEFRISNIARYTSDFTVPVSPYSGGSAVSYAYIGTTQPAKGFKFNVKTSNTTASTLTLEYWNGSAWATVSDLVDGTSSGGITLAQTGSATFNDTKSVAKVKVINSIALFFYRLTWSSVYAGTSIYYITVDSSLQQIQDIWDGVNRHCINFYKYTTAYNDLTIGIFEEDYSSANTATYADISSLTATTQYLLCGFPERQTALDITLVGGKNNTTASTTATVYYWNGSAWVAVSGQADGTSVGSISFNRSGVISWSPPESQLEFKQSFNGGVYLYFYKIVFNQNLSANVYIDLITGIPAQKSLGNYKYPFTAQSRLILCGETSSKSNTAIISATDTNLVFNGDDSIQFTFGNSQELTCGSNLYVQLGSSYENLMVFFKNFETWIVIGSSPQNWIQYQASDSIGCIAPNTLKSVNVSGDIVQSSNKYVLIFQASSGIYLFDGKTFYPISEDIKNLFDVNATTKINPTMISKSFGFFDLTYNEYHFLCATGSSTTLNAEFVYSFNYQKWFEIDRGSGKHLQCGMFAVDTNGYAYTYGFIDTGYCERLEYGTTFDGSPITYTIHFGDMILSDSVLVESVIRAGKLGMVSKTSGDITITHYGDSSTSGTENTLSVVNSNRCAIPGKTDNLGPFISHSFKFTYSSSIETSGFDPLIFGLDYKIYGINRD